MDLTVFIMCKDLNAMPTTLISMTGLFLILYSFNMTDEYAHAQTHLHVITQKQPCTYEYLKLPNQM